MLRKINKLFNKTVSVKCSDTVFEMQTNNCKNDRFPPTAQMVKPAVVKADEPLGK